MATAPVTVSIIQNWIEKGNNEKQVFDKFICYWIAFNSYYVNETGIAGDAKALKILNNQSNIIKFNEVLTNNLALFEKLKTVCPIKNERPNSTDEISLSNFVLSEVLDVLYQIRCNLFHGKKDYTNEDAARDKIVIDAATPVLEVMVKEFAKKISM